ncbi:MAG: glutamine amidotransferase-related protein [Alphaproteobacteria bacterium]
MTPTKSALLIVQRPESVTGRVGDVLAARGYHLDVCRVAAGDKLPNGMNDHDCAVIYGGPMSATDGDEHTFLTDELDWLPRAVASGKPVLGLCLGAQLMALAHGAEVVPQAQCLVEVGYYPIRPTDAGANWFPDPLMTYQFHGDAMGVPDDAVRLASSQVFPVQAFGMNGVPSFGLQFHPEVTRDMMERWVVRAAEMLKKPGAQSAEEHLDGQTRYDKPLEAWLEGFVDRWLVGETV